MKNTRVKKVILAILISTMCMTLTACGDISEYIDNWEAELKTRIEANQSEVEKIYKAGLLSDEQAKSLKEAIATQGTRVNDVFKSKPENALKYIVNAAGGIAGKGASGKGEQAVGMEIISVDNDAIKQLMDNLDFEVYVLKKDPLGTGKEENALATLDLISAEVAKAKEGKASNIDSYFVNSGRKVWDTSKPENKIIKDTVPSGSYSSTIGCGGLTHNVNTLGNHFIGVKTSYDKEHKHDHTDSIVELKLTEFNPSAVSRLVGADGVNKDVYVIVGKKCYLMQYPVQIVKGFKQEGNEFKAIYAESDMSINILTKNIMDKDGSVCTTTAGEIYKVNGEGGFGELGNASFAIDGMPGTMTKFGYAKKDNSGKDIEPSEELLKTLGRVVLRDYMELNYMPTVVENEDFVALGRKVRLTKFKGTGNEQVGLFVDKSGNEIQNSMRISINDIMGVVVGDSGTKDKLNLKNEADTQIPDGGQTGEAEVPENQEPEDVTNTFEIGASQDRILTPNYVEELEATTRFPGPLVATTDDLKLGSLQKKNEDGTDGESNTVADAGQAVENAVNSTGEEQIKHFMYGMAIDIDPFQSNLFSGWIEITGDNGDIGSLDWWNNWLNESTYRYRIDRDAVINFLSGNYMYEMRENGNIILDLDTITNIQQQYNKEDKVASANLIITLFAVLGFILIAYSTLILAAWVYDTNIIAGPRMMGVLSFGRWEAISDSDELPYMDTQSKHYMTFSKTLKACIVLIGVGILIIFVNILSIVDFFVLLFGQIAEVLGNVIQGMS